MAKEIKGDINFKIKLSEEQKEAKRLILDNQIVIITGKPGSGKSQICANYCLDGLFRKNIDKVFVSRPTVEVSKTLGYLPGELSSKYSPFTSAFMDNLMSCYNNTSKVQSLIEDKRIELYPIQFIRGKTIKENEVLVLEEAQNTSKTEMLAILTRLGNGAKIIINGDLMQKDGNFDGLEFALELFRNVEGIKHIELTENHRSGLVKDILDYVYK